MHFRRVLLLTSLTLVLSIIFVSYLMHTFTQATVIEPVKSPYVASSTTTTALTPTVSVISPSVPNKLTESANIYLVGRLGRLYVKENITPGVQSGDQYTLTYTDLKLTGLLDTGRSITYTIFLTQTGSVDIAKTNLYNQIPDCVGSPSLCVVNVGKAAAVTKASTLAAKNQIFNTPKTPFDIAAGSIATRGGCTYSSASDIQSTRGFFWEFFLHDLTIEVSLSSGALNICRSAKGDR